jgi:hypothetical protein
MTTTPSGLSLAEAEKLSKQQTLNLPADGALVRVPGGEGAEDLFVRTGDTLYSLDYKSLVPRDAQGNLDWQGKTIGHYKNLATSKIYQAVGGKDKIPLLNGADFHAAARGLKSGPDLSLEQLIPKVTNVNVDAVKSGDVQKQTSTGDSSGNIYTSLVDIWASRPDLRETFPQGTQAGTPDNTKLNDWWNQSGIKEYPNTTLVQPGDKRVQPPKVVEEQMGVPRPVDKYTPQLTGQQPPTTGAGVGTPPITGQQQPSTGQSLYDKYLTGSGALPDTGTGTGAVAPSAGAGSIQAPAASGQTQITGQVTDAIGANPMEGFSQAMLGMLQQYQGLNTADLLRKKNALLKSKYGRAQEITPEELRTLSPQQQNAIRQGQVSAIQPDISAVSTEITRQNQQMAQFGPMMTQARQIAKDIQTSKDAQKDSAFQAMATMANSGIGIDQISPEAMAELSQYSGLTDQMFQVYYTQLQDKAKRDQQLADMEYALKQKDLAKPYYKPDAPVDPQERALKLAKLEKELFASPDKEVRTVQGGLYDVTNNEWIVEPDETEEEWRDKLLTPSQAIDYAVPLGTTWGGVADKGTIPSRYKSGTGDGSDVSGVKLTQSQYNEALAKYKEQTGNSKADFDDLTPEEQNDWRYKDEEKEEEKEERNYSDDEMRADFRVSVQAGFSKEKAFRSFLADNKNTTDADEDRMRFLLDESYDQLLDESKQVEEKSKKWWNLFD